MYVVAQNRLPQSGQTLSEALFEFLINTTEMPHNIKISVMSRSNVRNEYLQIKQDQAKLAPRPRVLGKYEDQSLLFYNSKMPWPIGPKTYH